MKNREQIIEDLLGNIVHVEIDRPIGYSHNGLTYPVNYGSIPGVIADDGEEQDVYILGVSEPISSFDGRVVAVVRRLNDYEDKLIVVPDGAVLHQGEIMEAVGFQEQFFTTKVQSLFEKSCGILPYRQVGNHRQFLILLQTNSCWSPPKGHMEAGESEIQTAIRELYEETGLTASYVSGARKVIEYNISPIAKKQVVLYLGEVHGDVTLQKKEAVDYRWVRFSELENYLYPDTFQACAELIAALE